MNESPERRLMAAILARAVRDARDNDGYAAEARRWLLESDYAERLLDAFGIHRDRAAAWVDGLDHLRQEMLPDL